MSLSGRVAPPPIAAPARSASDDHPMLSRVVAAVAIIAIAARVDITAGLTVGTAIGVALAPVWMPRLARFSGARTLLALTVLGLASGLWLAGLATADHSVSTRALVETALLVAGIAISVGVILWARTIMSDSTVAVLFGVGMFLSIRPDSGLFLTNPWKYGIATATTVVLLSIADRIGRKWLAIATMGALAVVSAFTDGRSAFALLLLSGALLVWQVRPWRSGRTAAVLTVFVGLPLVVLIVYTLGQAVILEGYLGEATRARTESQIEQSGSLLVGGRPELAATIALMVSRPWGFGLGVIPTLQDITVAKTGMAAINYQPNNGYVENYMFGDGVELHSVAGDLWAHAGIPGLALAVFVVVIALQGLTRGIAQGTLTAVVAFLVVRGLWNMAFGPLYSSVPLLVLMIALALRFRSSPAIAAELELADRTPRPPRRPSGARLPRGPGRR